MNGLKKKNKLPVYSLALFGRYGIGKSLKFLQTLTCENGPPQAEGPLLIVTFSSFHIINPVPHPKATKQNENNVQR